MVSALIDPYVRAQKQFVMIAMSKLSGRGVNSCLKVWIPQLLLNFLLFSLAFNDNQSILALTPNIAVAVAPSTVSIHQPTTLKPIVFDPVLYKVGALVRRNFVPQKANDVAVNKENAQASSPVVLIDFENVRGQTAFESTHRELLYLIQEWTRICELHSRVICVIDHGSTPTAVWMSDNDTVGMSLIFAGPLLKADDVIANESLGWLGQDNNVYLVTADQGLIQRCQSTSVHKKLLIVSPKLLLQDLEKVARVQSSYALDERIHQTPDKLENVRSLHRIKLDYHVKVGAELLETEVLLQNRMHVKNKRRKKLVLKSKTLRQKLEGSSVLERVTNLLKHGRQGEQQLSNDTDRLEQDALLSRLEEARRKALRREKTEDRVVLVEKWRLELCEKYTGSIKSESCLALPAYMYAKYVHDRSVSSIEVPTGSLRLVVISDTHGFEHMLTSSHSKIPDGDVLLHLGDFTVDRVPKDVTMAQLERFDMWLATLPHERKIILRGNHDPKSWIPIHSNAEYIIQPECSCINGVEFAFVPYTSGTLPNRKLPKSFDVLASHVPPKNTLDRCLTGKQAGSHSLKRCVEKMKSNAPVLWLCGHIHEARGAVRHTFRDGNREVLVVNAAMANPGIASTLLHNPVVLDVSQNPHNKREKQVNLVSMDGQYTHLNMEQRAFFTNNRPVDYKELLLSVDLGLRTGISLFRDDGQLLRYQQIEFPSALLLEIGAASFLSNWERDASKSEQVCRITRIAIEGSDVLLWKAWRNAAQGIMMLEVKPDEWRNDLLQRSDLLSGEAAKVASLNYARNFVAQQKFCQSMEPLHTDVAESIMLGIYVSKRLDWIK